MKYTKPSLTFSEQADLLIRRGLEATREEIIEKLKTVSYYRLSAYWYPFRQPDDSLLPGTTLAVIWRRYTFDRQLRLVMMDAVERVEIAIRTQLVYHHTQRYGPFGYLDRAHLQGISVEDHRQLLERIREEARRSGEEFVKHFYAKYTAETDLPLWMASELMTFGNMLTFFRGVDTGLKQTIAVQFGVADRVLESWLRALNQVRNICAHHGRIWNRVFGLRPLIPRENKHPEWHRPVVISSDRVFGILSILQFLLAQVAPQSAWKSRLLELLGRYPDIPVKGMGFPPNWTESPFWK
jgi:abortive infection bacteriophage resistance protein